MFEMPYYHTNLTISAGSSMYAIICMHEIPGWPTIFCQNLLNITQVHWNQYRSCVRNGILSYNSYYTAVCCVNTVNSMWIFCMHVMPRLPATFAEIWCMHLKTLHGILFPRTQRAPCDVSSSNAWVNRRPGIVIINVTLVYVRIYIYM